MTEPVLLARASDLFNRKLYFECHDLLEDAWAGERGPERDFLQALIRVAVGMYHVAAGNHKGAVSQLGQGLRALEPFRPQRGGLDVESLVAGVRHCLDKSEHALHVGKGGSVGWTAHDIPKMRLVL
jgi:predicted metal-dependent hydrolase